MVFSERLFFMANSAIYCIEAVLYFCCISSTYCCISFAYWTIVWIFSPIS